ncbi:MAG TPA: sulfatase [Kiritimatiellia bacterium]|nr:sulfatase [Kiritimatiellia bacterium]HRZ12567.1 sulfatase [Kiritimatiellia bacterium]HSA17645.1 sulfatase [Kiritimatiellia bacterium]
MAELERRNLLILLPDALRPDQLGCYGSTRGNSPVVDRLAAEGIVFENAFTVSPVTNVSVSTLFTGCLPKVHGVRLHTSVLARGVPTLAERLRAEGYQTGAVISCATMDRSRGLDRGFDFYDDAFGPEEPKGIKGADPDERTISRHAGTAVSLALQWLRGLDPGRPFFLFLHLFDTHSPYDPPRDWRESHPTAYAGRADGSEKEGLAIKLGEFVPGPEDIAHLNYLYGGELNHTDRQVARLLSALSDLGRAENLLTVFTADHGVHLGERGVWGSGRRLYDRELRVPLVLHGLPGLAGRRVSTLVPNTDVMPTLLEALGCAAPAGLNGRSRLAEARNPDAADDTVIYAETFMPAAPENQRLAVRNRRWKLITPVPPEERAVLLSRPPGETWQRIRRLLYRLWHNRKGRKEQFRRALDVLFGGREKDAYRRIEDRDRQLLGSEPELYDVRNDPGEEKNVYAARPRVARLMANELAFFSSRYIRRSSAAEQLSPEQLREANEVLRQLGYK